MIIASALMIGLAFLLVSAAALLFAAGFLLRSVSALKSASPPRVPSFYVPPQPRR
jgi:hypothetical protein